MLTPYYLSFLIKFLGDYRLTMLQILSITKWFFIQISIIHDNICSLIHKKCHPKTCHNKIKYCIQCSTSFVKFHSLRNPFCTSTTTLISITCWFVHTREKKYLHLIYIMCNGASRNTPFHTRISLYMVQECKPQG